MLFLSLLLNINLYSNKSVVLFIKETWFINEIKETHDKLKKSLLDKKMTFSSEKINLDGKIILLTDYINPKESKLYDYIKEKNGIINDQWKALISINEYKAPIKCSFFDDGILIHFYLPKISVKLEEDFKKLFDSILTFINKFSIKDHRLIIDMKTLTDYLKEDIFIYKAKIGIMKSIEMSFYKNISIYE